MSSAPDGQAAFLILDARASEIEALADSFLAFIEDVEAALCAGQVPPALAERLAQLLRRAERLP